MKKVNVFKKIQYFIEYILVIILGNIIKLMPLKIGYKIANILAKLIYYLDLRDRKIALNNIDIIFKENPIRYEEKIKIIKNAFKMTTNMVVEFLKRGDITKENYEKYAKLDGLENVDKALSYGKGVIVITAHLGNFEWLGDIPAKLGYNVGVIIKRQFNPYTDKWLRDFREKYGGMKNFYNDIKDLVKIVKFLKNNGIIAIVADQTHYFKPIFVPFFGVESATASGPAELHLKYGSPIIMAFSIRQKENTYLMKYEEPKIFEPTGNFDQDCKTIMAWVNKKFEEYIIKYIDQWFSLFHPRWERTKPEDFNLYEDSPYN